MKCFTNTINIFSILVVSSLISVAQPGRKLLVQYCDVDLRLKNILISSDDVLNQVSHVDFWRNRAFSEMAISLDFLHRNGFSVFFDKGDKDQEEDVILKFKINKNSDSSNYELKIKQSGKIENVYFHILQELYIANAIGELIKSDEINSSITFNEFFKIYLKIYRKSKIAVREDIDKNLSKWIELENLNPDKNIWHGEHNDSKKETLIIKSKCYKLFVSYSSLYEHEE